MIPVPSKKKNKPEILRLLETLRKPWKINISATWKASARKRSDAPPPRRAQGSQCHTMKIIGKSLVFACPGRCNTVQPAESLCAAWEILWLLENLWKPLGKHGFRPLSVQNKKQPPLRIPFLAKSDSKIKPLETNGKPLEIIGKTWFPGLVGPKLKTASYGSLSWQRAIPK